MSNFDFFQGARSTTSKEPEITLRRSGQMVLTPAAVAMLGDDASHVQIGFDQQTRAIGLRSAPEGTKGRYRLREQGNGSSVVNGRRFCKHHGIELDKAKTFPAEELGEGIVGFRLGEADASAESESEASPAKPAKKTRGGKKAAA